MWLLVASSGVSPGCLRQTDKLICIVTDAPRPPGDSEYFGDCCTLTAAFSHVQAEDGVNFEIASITELMPVCGGAFCAGRLYQHEERQRNHVGAQDRVSVFSKADQHSAPNCSVDARRSAAVAIPHAHHGRLRFRSPLSTSYARFTSSTTWKSYMPAHTKSAPFSKANWNASRG